MQYEQLRPELAERIKANTVEDGDCLRWTAGCCSGHPAMRWGDKKSAMVRRVLWEEVNGPIPPGKILRCTCETPKCVNIEHAKLATYRGVALELGAVGVMSGPVRSARIAAVKRAGKQSRISQDDARTIRESEDKGADLAQRYGISEGTVSKIRLGKVRREFGGNVWQGLGA
jgi:hypothetical protein